MVEVIPLKYGTTFKKAFSQPHVFCQFVRDVLGIDIDVDTVHTEYEYPKAIGYVKIKYDLFAEDTARRIIVEIQHVKEADFFNRFLYYHLISLAEQVKSYRAYGFDRTVYTIVVLTSVPRDQSVGFSVATSDMSPIDEFGQRIGVYPHRLVFLSPRNLNPQTPPGVKAWLELVADSLDGQIDETNYNQPAFQSVIETIESQKLSPEELSEIKDEQAWEDLLEQNTWTAKADIAISLLKQGVDVAVIAEATGLSPEEIDALNP